MSVKVLGSLTVHPLAFVIIGANCILDLLIYGLFCVDGPGGITLSIAPLAAGTQHARNIGK